MILVDQSASLTDGREAARLQKHATEFEGILLNEILKDLQRTFSQTENQQEGDAASGTISGLGTQALAQALAAKNVLGVGRMVARQLGSTTTAVTSLAMQSPYANADVAGRTEKIHERPKVAQSSADK